MSKPTAREIRAVSQVPVLSEQEVSTLYEILLTLGFDVETIALVWNRNVTDVKTLFRVDVNGSRKPCMSHMTGLQLAWFCDLIHLRPGVVQQRINFDESPRGRKKVGRSSSHAILPWVGPPICCIKGAVTEGKVFAALVSQVSLPVQSQPNPFVLAQISAGKYPLRLQMLRDVLRAAEKADVTHPKIDALKYALSAFPLGIRTAEEAFDVLTMSESIHPMLEEEEPMKPDLVTPFQNEFRARGLGQVFAQLLAVSSDFRNLCDAANIGGVHKDLSRIGHGAVIFPAEFEALLQDKRWSAIRRAQQSLASQLDDMKTWLKSKRDELSHVSVVQPKPLSKIKVAAPLFPEETNAFLQRTALATRSLPIIPEAIVQYAASAHAVVVMERVDVDAYGISWNWIDREITIGAFQVPMDKSDDVSASDFMSLSRKVYESLKCLKEIAGELDWQTFVTSLKLERSFVSSLYSGSVDVTPSTVENILDGLQRVYQLTLTPEQLFGLESLPHVEVVAKKTESAEPVLVSPVPLLFEKGDVRMGYMWGSLLRMYRVVSFWFRTEYGITDEQIAAIEKGELGVPVSVHLMLLQKVTERLASAADPVVPRSFTYLLNLAVSEPVRRGTFDQKNNPQKDWFKRQ